MDNIFNADAWEEFRGKGFVKPGITLSPTTLDAVRELIRSPRTKGSPVSSFRLHADGRVGEGLYGAHSGQRIRNWMTLALRPIVARHFPSLIHRHFSQRNFYSRTCYPASDVLPTVLDEFMALGLAKQLTANHMLTGHDLFLENSSDQKGFGLHADPWSLEIFYSTDDDVSAYIQLQDVNEQTGGRLMVDPTFETSLRFRHRNRMMKEFSEICEKLGSIDDDGNASREVVLRSKAARNEFRRLRSEWEALPRPKSEDLSPVDARAGEVTLFSNRHFHSTEPWASHNKVNRSVYIVRCMPIYDVKLQLPSSFLDGVPCNRFVLDPKNERVLPIDPQTNVLQRYGIPLPLLADA
jgi:hypothetical protein